MKRNLQDVGLEWIDGEYCSNTSKLICIDKDGYKYSTTYQNAIKKNVCIVGKTNPFSIDNIKLFLIKNDLDIELISNIYESSEAELVCKCLKCGQLFKTRWDYLKRKKGCLKCSYLDRNKPNRNTLESVKKKLEFLNPSLTITSDKYINTLNKLDIRCEQGHDFKRTWNALSQNPKCPKCSYENMDGSFNETLAKRNRNEWLNVDSSVYVIECFDKFNDELFYKIGITTRSVADRFRTQTEMPYEYETKYIIKANLYECVYIEKELHFFHRNYQYYPKKDFEGYTECFRDINDELIQKYIEFYNNRKTLGEGHLFIDNKYYNLNIEEKETLEILLIKLNIYRMSMEDLNIWVQISGYDVIDWIDDINAKLSTFTYKKRKKELEDTEKQLDLLLSEEKKTELEIERLAKILG